MLRPFEIIKQKISSKFPQSVLLCFGGSSTMWLCTVHKGCEERARAGHGNVGASCIPFLSTVLPVPISGPFCHLEGAFCPMPHPLWAHTWNSCLRGALYIYPIKFLTTLLIYVLFFSLFRAVNCSSRQTFEKLLVEGRWPPCLWQALC